MQWLVEAELQVGFRRDLHVFASSDDLRRATRSSATSQFSASGIAAPTSAGTLWASCIRTSTKRLV